jgi:hypothetical protein
MKEGCCNVNSLDVTVEDVACTFRVQGWPARLARTAKPYEVTPILLHEPPEY